MSFLLSSTSSLSWTATSPRPTPWPGCAQFDRCVVKPFLENTFGTPMRRTRPRGRSGVDWWRHGDLLVVVNACNVRQRPGRLPEQELRRQPDRCLWCNARRESSCGRHLIGARQGVRQAHGLRLVVWTPPPQKGERLTRRLSLFSERHRLVRRVGRVRGGPDRGLMAADVHPPDWAILCMHPANDTPFRHFV